MIYYRFKTKVGDFHILQRQDGNWHPMFQDEDLGPYQTAQHALDDLAGGHTYWPSCGDPSQYGLPDELSEWELVRAR